MPDERILNQAAGPNSEAGPAANPGSSNGPTTAPGPGSSKEEVALELMRFIAGTTGFGKTSVGAGFGGKSPKTPEEQVEALLELYQRCRAALDQPGTSSGS